MKKLLSILFIICMLCYVPALFAGEHGGKEHGGTTQEHGGKTQEPGGATQEHGGKTQEHGGKTQEHGGKTMPEPSADAIKAAMGAHVAEKAKKTGTFEINDPVEKKTRFLTLQRIHERVGKTGAYYYSCADFKDTKSGELLDLDLDVEHKDGKLNVVDVRIHKVEGKPRYTYDDNDNRIPLK